jgi:hypothetical protein
MTSCVSMSETLGKRDEGNGRILCEILRKPLRVVNAMLQN